MASFGATASASASASVANNVPKSSTYLPFCHRHFQHSHSKVAFRITTKPKLRLFAKPCTFAEAAVLPFTQSSGDGPFLPIRMLDISSTYLYSCFISLFDREMCYWFLYFLRFIYIEMVAVSFTSDYALKIVPGRVFAGQNGKFTIKKVTNSGLLKKNFDYLSNWSYLFSNRFCLNPADEGPGIEGFQIIGDAKPGNKLLGCGYPVRGTSLCMFQWVRHYPDGTRQYIDGATNPDYIVTADDVDKLIAVECIPMDEQGRQGKSFGYFSSRKTPRPGQELHR